MDKPNQDNQTTLEKLKQLNSIVLLELACSKIIDEINNREAFLAAVPIIVASQHVAAKLFEKSRKLSAAAAKLSLMAAEYAKTHQTALDNALHEERDGIISGLVMIDEVNYRLTISKDKPKREDGNLTAKFLDSLPPAWTKSKLELSVTAMNDLGVTDENLADYGLFRPEKAVWAEVINAECIC